MDFLKDSMAQLKVQQKAAAESMKILESQFSIILPMVRETNPELADEVLRLKNEMQKPENIQRNSEFLNKFEGILKNLQNAC